MSTTEIDLAALKARVKGEKRTATASVQWNPERREGSDLRVSGWAAVFESESEDLGFIETLAPGCFERALSRPGADPYLLLGHDRNAILARRSAGTLELREDAHGLAFEANIVPTTQGRDVALLVKSGHLDGCSFGFTVAKDQWTERGGQAYRRVTEIGELFEITLTGNPAYSAASVRDRELQARIERTVARARKERNTTASPYTIDGPHSYFRDLVTISRAKEAWETAFAAGRGPVLPADGYLDGAMPNIVHGGLGEARARMVQLDRHLAETRDNTTSSTAGGGFVPAGVPAYVAEAFATAARAKAVLPSVLPVRPLADVGMVSTTPSITTGAGAAVITTENSTAPDETTLVEALISSPVSLIAGMADISQALLDRSFGVDLWLADELGKAVAAELDLLLLTGTGTGLSLLGLDNVTSPQTVTYTDGSPTAAEFTAAAAQLAGKVATALGDTPDLLIVHPRREAWVAGSSSTLPALPFGMRTVSCSSVTTLAGTSTTEDVAYVLASRELPILLGLPVFRVMPDAPGGGSLTVRCVSHMYANALFQRRPEAVGILSGTGLVAPA